MSSAAQQPAFVAVEPHVARRAALGVIVVLVVLGALAVFPSGPNEGTAPRPEHVLLRFDPDTATRDELMLLPGIGPTIAGYIIEHREQARPGRAFHRAEDLDNVHRIGPVTVSKLRPLLRFPPQQPDRPNTEVLAP